MSDAICLKHGKRIYKSVTGWRHFAADGGDLCFDSKGEYNIQMKPTKAMIIHKEGDIWDIPRSISPMWTKQWGYQGSSKMPYIISFNPERTNGSTTDEGWACSCPNFTRHTPRTPCKHILNIMLKMGKVTVTATAKANASQGDLAEFEKWKREKAAAAPKEPVKDAKLNLFGATGRKFR